MLLARPASELLLVLDQLAKTHSSTSGTWITQM
jgi:hypothetical protein